MRKNLKNKPIFLAKTSKIFTLISSTFLAIFFDKIMPKIARFCPTLLTRFLGVKKAIFKIKINTITIHIHTAKLPQITKNRGVISKKLG